MKNSQRKFKDQRGFTLVETIIYIAIFAIIMSGSIVSIYGILATSSKNQLKAMVQEEGSFLLGKIDWALTGVKIDINGFADIDTPSSGLHNDKLVLTKFEPSPSGTLIEINIASNDMTVKRNSGSVSTLNNDNVSISCPVDGCFVHSSGNPESIKADFIVTTKTDEGLSYSQEFSTIKYLRK